MARCPHDKGFRKYRDQFVCKRCGRLFDRMPMGFWERLFHRHKWRADSRRNPLKMRCRRCGETMDMSWEMMGSGRDDLQDPAFLEEFRHLL